MKAKSFGEEHIITVLRETEAGAKTKELCWRHGISNATPGRLPESSRWAVYLVAGSPEAMRKPDGKASRVLDQWLW